jgi:hypothetical protein
MSTTLLRSCLAVTPTLFTIFCCDHCAKLHGFSPLLLSTMAKSEDHCAHARLSSGDVASVDRLPLLERDSRRRFASSRPGFESLSAAEFRCATSSAHHFLLRQWRVSSHIWTTPWPQRSMLLRWGMLERRAVRRVLLAVKHRCGLKAGSGTTLV